MSGASNTTSMDAYVSSLSNSFRQVPPVAVPAMLDCVTASTSLTPSSLLSALLDAFPHLTKDILHRGEKFDTVTCNYLRSFISALCHLLKKPGANLGLLQAYFRYVLAPMTRQLHPDDFNILSETVASFIDAANETNNWEVVETTLFPFFLRLVGTSMGMVQSEEMAVYQWSRFSFFQTCKDQETDTEIKADAIPLHVSCKILASVLEIALSQYSSRPVAGKIAGNMLWDLSSMALRMLMDAVEPRSSAIRVLLPSIFKAFLFCNSFEVMAGGQVNVLSREYFFEKIWMCCRDLFPLGRIERADAYSVLSLYFSNFLNGYEGSNAINKGKGFDIRAETDFWSEIKRGLVDDEGIVRKQSLHILKMVLQLDELIHPDISDRLSNSKSSTTHALTKKERWAETEAKSLGVGKEYDTHHKWGAFFLLYEMLEEYGTHLVEAAWNHQITLLLHSSVECGVTSSHICEGLHQNEIGASSEMFSWLIILWERGFSHDNPHVRSLIMDSFLDIEWSSYGSCVKLVPEVFLLGPFIKGLDDPVHHKEFGAKGNYSSRTIKGAVKFFHQYSSYLNSRKHISFLRNLASVARKHSFGRAGLMSLAECIASAAIGARVHRNGVVKLSNGPDMVSVEAVTESVPHSEDIKLLDVLRYVIENSKQHFNPKYRLQVCEKILDAISSTIHAFDVPFEVLLLFISAVPREFSDYGGPLYEKVHEWLQAPIHKHLDSSCWCSKLWENISNFPLSFIRSNCSNGIPVTYNDEEIDAWESEAKRWAKVVFLVTNRDSDLDPILMLLRVQGTDFCKESYQSDTSVKFLILISSLVQELEIMQQRISDGGMKITSTKGDVTYKVDHFSSAATNTLFKKFADLFLSFLGPFVSFATSSCSVFWSGDLMVDNNLPCSVRGKLGGPSQRRLSSSTTASVLQAIISVKAVASISLWCVKLKSGHSLKFAFTFLWDFFWKLVSSPKCDSETAAEIYLGAYEALSHVLKTIVFAFTPLSLDIVINNDKLLSSNAECCGPLDGLALSFVQNISDLIAVEHLARSRRAVLINMKWTCLELLLSIPSRAFQDGVSKENTYFFSKTRLQEIFGDLVDSLENAGDASVLPMLRSIRLVLELFGSIGVGSSLSSVDGSDVQIVWRLVQSSWILHANSSKRRVAPIAALLSSVLHYSLFPNENMHESNSEPGPLKWFIERILEDGKRSPRTTRLAALHLTGLWLLYPHTIKYYMKELNQLTLYGSVAFDEDFAAELISNDDAKTELALLAKSPDAELTEEFVNTELFARVSVAVLFQKLADLAAKVDSDNIKEVCHVALESGRMFLLELLDFAVNDKEISKELYKKYSGVHRRKIRVWQMICILSPFVDEETVDKVTSSMHICLDRNNLPAVRQYLETVAINIYLKFPLLVKDQLLPIFLDYDMRPQALSSYVFIAANVIMHASPEVQQKHLEELLPPIIPLLTSHHHSLRGFTQLLVYQIFRKLLPSLDSSTYEILPLEKKCFEDLKSYLAKSPDCTRLRTSMEGYLDAFNPKDSVTPAGIFSNRVDESEFECVPMCLMEQVINFLNEVREGLRTSMAKDAETIKSESLRLTKEPPSAGMLDDEGREKLLSQAHDDILMNFQRKITVSTNHEKHEVSDHNDSFSNKDYLAPLFAMEKEDQLLDQLLHSEAAAVEKITGGRQHLILVASLLDRIPNLAGLARTCEVFKASGLVVADKSIMKDKQFQLISVTAEKWVPMIEVPVNSLKVFLERKKQDGFAILGLEQTANSVSLDKYAFPQKTVLVLGREKEGIPVDIIHMLDKCIEIPQLGVVRSLNVHVSGAIALWEYTRQQMSLKS
ncbi:uncharacterized protein LOC124928866 [Impatiens glandulifera]|uniref:uncharacterized protein LOC124928866 n=1 Tax=Impatiens glandulifera TaxID=253017 RepID=UPI001FB148AA|nr:uncharacterized protein LOC124928866 [Impatiens glandulifera]